MPTPQENLTTIMDAFYAEMNLALADFHSDLEADSSDVKSLNTTLVARMNAAQTTMQTGISGINWNP
jgi:hypothetical protein